MVFVAMDIWSKEKRSQVMARIRGRDTRPELIVRRYLYSRGYRYRKNVKGLPGTPDIVLRKHRVAVFIHGCFWHGHETHQRIPDTNRDFWQRKIERNKERDLRDKERLLAMGWSVVTIWECQLKPAVRARTLAALEYYINHNYLRIQQYKPTVAPMRRDEIFLTRPYGSGDDESGVMVAAEPGEVYRPTRLVGGGTVDEGHGAGGAEEVGGGGPYDGGGDGPVAGEDVVD